MSNKNLMIQSNGEDVFKSTDNIMEAINSSIDVDHRMVLQDIEGSIAHVKMLKFQK